MHVFFLLVLVLQLGLVHGCNEYRVSFGERHSFLLVILLLRLSIQSFLKGYVDVVNYYAL